MKRYIRTTSLITESDYKAALLLLNHTRSPKEIERAQKTIREYKDANPKLAEKIKNEIEAKRDAQRHAPKQQSKYRW